MNDSGAPSLIMQAAQSAAQADGLAAPPTVTSMVNTNNSNLQQGGNVNVASMNNNGGMAGPGPAATAAALMQQQQQQQQVAARKSNSSGGGGSSSKKKGPALRRGKWTAEEEAYANRLIQEFKAGLLPLTDGTTLRTFLSKLLNCDPMRISKKFVGSNCIGKQVFRRRTADLNRLTPEQIQKSRAELSELERRFLERVAQTNRVKNSNNGAGGGGANGATGGAVGAGGNGMQNVTPSSMVPSVPLSNNPLMMGNVGAGPNGMGGAAAMNNMMAAVNGMGVGGGLNGGMTGMNPLDNMGAGAMANPPWMQPPIGYKQGMGAQMAAANLAGGQSNSRAAAAGRALLGGLNPGSSKNGKNGLSGGLSAANMFAMAELQRRASQQTLGGLGNPSAQDLLAALQSTGSSSSLAQMARNASAAGFGAFGGGANNNSLNNLVLKTGFSRDQLSQLARDRGLSGASLSNMADRKSSFDALMNLDYIQSLQSIDNLANLIQTGGASNSKAPESGMKNWSADSAGGAASSGLSSAARRLASASNLESFMRTLSNNNMSRTQLAGLAGVDTNGDDGAGPSASNLQSLLQGMSNGNLAGAASSMSSLLGAANGGGANGGGTSAASLANLLRENQSSTGLSALRNQDGDYNRNTSVEDFLSLVAAGDIPHQDASLLNLPLSQLQQQQLQQQQQQQMPNGGNKSFTNFELLQQMTGQTNSGMKRELDVADGTDGQGPSKRR